MCRHAQRSAWEVSETPNRNKGPHPDRQYLLHQIRSDLIKELASIEPENQVEFLRRRLEETTAHNLTLMAAEAARQARDTPPPQLVEALRAQGRRYRRVQVEVSGVSLAVVVRPTGRVDPNDEERRWR